MKGIVLSTHPTINKWKTLKSKLAFFDVIYNSGKAGTVWKPWVMEQVTVVPKVVKEKIDHAWLQELQLPYFNKGYDYVKFHASIAQQKEWGIKASLKGSNPREDTEYEAMYFFANEDTKRKGLNQFEQTGGHEGAHGYYQDTKLPDIVHAWHGANADISGLFTTFDWNLYQAKRKSMRKQITLLQSIVKALIALLAKKPETRLLHPVAEYREIVSQAYGVPNKVWYPLTGHHIGTDYACPVGTPVKAPWTGEVIISGSSPALGNFCHYKYNFKDITYVSRFMHLTGVPVLGQYKRSDIIELSGKSGDITGPHLHVDVFHNEIRLDKLTTKNWNLLTINPQTHYAN